MTTRVADRVEDWDSQPFDGGFRELHTLADREFSGVVRAGSAELYMTSGTCVGIRQGGIDDFEAASGTLYRSPSDALPLLAIMQARSDEVHAKYYSEKTSIAEVDRTLSEGSFTGYIELSENVLSGDYYLVYHAGRSMSVAYVGEAEQLLDGDEAFERADGEVGIYQVYKVDVDIVEIPDPGGSVSGAGTGTGGRVAGPGAGAERYPDSTGQDEDSAGAETPETDEPGPGTADESVTTSASGSTGNRVGEGEPDGETWVDGRGGAGEDETPSDPVTSSSGESASERTDSDGGGTRPSGASGTEAQPDGTERRRDRAESETTVDETGERAEDTGSEVHGETGRTDPSTGADTPEESTEQAGGTSDASGLERRTVPSLDPDRTVEGGGIGRSEEQSPTTAGPQSDRTREVDTERHSKEPAVAPERIEQLESELEEREGRIEQLESELAAVREERDGLQSELADLRSERDDLGAEVDRLQSELERLETERGAAADAERRLTESEALAGTDLFVRYHSKGDATLAKAHSSGVRKEDVNGNLRVETHTTFDDTKATVDGQSFHEFLERTPQYQFVQWVVRELLFEIRSTGHEAGLQDLYDALPDIDRVELSGVVEVTHTEDGGERRTEEAFDVILRDRMGNPLLAANLNDSREAATESMIEELITTAERVGRSVDQFAAAFMVTGSFFEPGALETTSAATRGGLLSRDKRKSFVNLSRKRGYHLCLVEARNDNFHLTVPEL